MSDPAEEDRRKALVKALTALSTNTTSAANVSSHAAGLGSGLGALRSASVRLLDFGADEALKSSYHALQQQMVELTKKVEESRTALQKADTTKKAQDAAIQSLEGNVKQLESVNRLGFLLSRVCPEAQQQLMKSEKFQKLFLEPTPCNAFVMSVDIRRSTELMLKARSPEKFSHFITALCQDLVEIVRGSLGVLDKFTGDGILAFFPDFYSGDDAGYRTIAAADQCHKAFSNHYNKSRTSFSSILTDVGLGIGIDYGMVHLVQVAGSLTVVGEPVVYACRLSAAPAGLTYVNQPAYEQISQKFGTYCLASERTLDIKHEGSMLAYAMQLTQHAYEPVRPTWPAS